MLSILALLGALLPMKVNSAAVDPHPWIAPGAGDVRSPCPGLNALANHGILPRSGKNLTLAILNAGLLEGLNVGEDFTTVIGTAGLLSSPDPLAGAFDLDNLDEHNFPIEHDASLSRNDFYFGDNHDFDADKWQQVLAFIDPADGNSTTTTVDYTSGAKARLARVAAQRAANPTFSYDARQLVLSYGETALYLSTMGSPAHGEPAVAYVRMLFEQERLPYSLGWRKPAEQTTLASLGAMILQLEAAGGETLPEGLVLGETTLANALDDKDPITGLTSVV